MAKLSVTKAEKALREHRGILSKAAEACGVSRKYFYKFMEDYPELEEVRAEASDELLDIAEANVVQELERGEMKTTRWFLDRKGKDRGYTTRQEQTGRDGEPLVPHSVRREIVDVEDEDT